MKRIIIILTIILIFVNSEKDYTDFVKKLKADI